MKKNKRVFWILVIALVNATILSTGQALNNQMILAGAILLFCVLALCNYKEFFLPLLLFYLPWSSLLRFNPSSSSFHTLVIPVAFLLLLIRFIKKQNNFSQAYFAYAIIITAYTMIVKFLNGLSLDTPYIIFIIMLFFIPLYLEQFYRALRFDVSIVFLSIGNISASIASNLLITNKNVLQYIDINQEMQVGLRLSGFYGDPNFYSALMLVSIAGLLIILTEVRNKMLTPPIILMITALCYFAMQSVSKMFVLCLGMVFFLWIINMMISNFGLGYKLGILATFAAIVIIVLAKNIFTKEINYYIFRFGKVNDSVSLTTGRVVLWKTYIDYLLSNPDKLFFGIGVSENQIIRILKTIASHMTIIQTIYQLGIAGTTMFLLWWKSVYDALKTKPIQGLSSYIKMGIMSLAIFLPWLALDMLYFREYFYFVVLLFSLKEYLATDQMTAGRDIVSGK